MTTQNQDTRRVDLGRYGAGRELRKAKETNRTALRRLQEAEEAVSHWRDRARTAERRMAVQGDSGRRVANAEGRAVRAEARARQAQEEANRGQEAAREAEEVLGRLRAVVSPGSQAARVMAEYGHQEFTGEPEPERPSRGVRHDPWASPEPRNSAARVLSRELRAFRRGGG